MSATCGVFRLLWSLTVMTAVLMEPVYYRLPFLVKELISSNYINLKLMHLRSLLEYICPAAASMWCIIFICPPPPPLFVPNDCVPTWLWPHIDAAPSVLLPASLLGSVEESAGQPPINFPLIIEGGGAQGTSAGRQAGLPPLPLCPLSYLPDSGPIQAGISHPVEDVTSVSCCWSSH